MTIDRLRSRMASAWCAFAVRILVTVREAIEGRSATAARKEAERRARDRWSENPNGDPVEPQ